MKRWPLIWAAVVSLTVSTATFATEARWSTIFFALDSDRLDTAAREELDRTIPYLNFLFEEGFQCVEVTGYTDTTGSPVYNMDLSRRRVATVVNRLIDKGISNIKIKTAWYGEDVLALRTPDDTPEPLNRMVEVSADFTGKKCDEAPKPTLP